MREQAYIYARFSTKAQDKGSSLDRQFEACRALAIRREWQVVETITDRGQSAWKGDHLRVGELGRFKQRVDQGDIPRGSYLVIENLDRLSRMDVKKSRRWIEEVTEAGVSIAVCRPEKIFDEASLSGENIIDLLQYLLEAQRSNKEGDRKSDLQKGAIAGFMARARQGIVYSKTAPAWLSGQKGGSFEVVEDRAAVVRQIYEWSASGMGGEAIAQKLNATVEPWTKPQKSSKPSWKVGYIRDILVAPSVEGEYHIKSGSDRKPTGEILHNYYPRIVPHELVDRARTARLNRRGTGGPNHSEARNLFAGRVTCGHCGDTMIRTVGGGTKKAYEYLRCVRDQNGAGCDNSVLYRYDLFERAALDEILHLALDSTHFRRTDELGPLLARAAEAKKLVETLEAERANLMAFIRKHGEDEDTERDLLVLRPRLSEARRAREIAQEAADRARGQVTPEEHLQRVMEVRQAIHSEDQDVRNQARRQVRDAIQAVVSGVACRMTRPDPDVRPVKRTPSRTITMALASGGFAFQFNNSGECTGRINLHSDPAMERGLYGGELESYRVAGDAIERRRAAKS